MFGLRVNFSKSFHIPIGKVPEIEHLGDFFGCRIDYLPSSYLGHPLGANFKSIVWEPIVEMFHKKLRGWKSKRKVNLIEEHFKESPYLFHVLVIIAASEGLSLVQQCNQ